MWGADAAKHLLESFFGIQWPDGDPDKCRQAAGYWRQAAAAVDDARGRTQAAAQAVSATCSGRSVDAFAADVTRFSGFLDALAAECRTLAGALDQYADQLDTVRHRLIVIAEQVAADIAVTIAFGFLTAGLADLASAGVLAAFGVEALSELSGLMLTVARIASTLSYYALDSVVYGAMDQGSQALVLAANGDPVGSLPDNVVKGLQIGVANVGFDAAIDLEFTAVNKARALAAAQPGLLGRVGTRIPEDVTTTNLPLRAAARLGASSLAYSPILHAEQGTDLLPDQSAMEQKLTIHFAGRLLVDRFRLGRAGR
jgi:uncharacterized protein YukE